jgi:hypothetical protein
MKREFQDLKARNFKKKGKKDLLIIIQFRERGVKSQIKKDI